MKVKIYKPAKNAMQSGRANTAAWVLEYELTTPRRPEAVMGWVASEDTLNQVRLKFPTREEAVAFAEKEGFAYTVTEPQARTVKPQSYLDNFKYRAAED